MSLRNFLSFGDDVTEISLGDFNVIVGPNGAGKTNLLRALTYLGEVLNNRNPGPSFEYYRAGVDEFKLEVGTALSEEERYALADCIVCGPLTESVTVGPTESQPVVQQHAFETAAALRDTLAAAFANIDLVVHGLGNQTDAPDVSLRFKVGGMSFLMGRFGGIRNTEEPITTGTTLQFARFLVDALQSADPRRDFSDQFFAQLHEALETRYVSAQLTSFLTLTDLERRQPAREYGRRLGRFLRDRGFFLDSFTFFQLVGVIYGDAIISASDLRTRTKGFVVLPTEPALWAGSFQGIGDDLGLTLFRLKNSMHSEERERYNSIKVSFKAFFNQSFDFDVVLRDRLESPSAQSLAPYQTVSPDQGPLVANQARRIAYEVAVYVQDGRAWVHLDFAAAGIFEVLFLLTTVVGRRDKTLLLDEPALNLHPTKQLELRRLLEESVQKSSNQVILTTHSPFMVSGRGLEHTLRFQVKDAQTKVQRLAMGTGDVVARMVKEFERNTKAVSILFANKVLLVEGDDEEAALPIWFEKCEFSVDLEGNNWVLLNVRGDQSLRGFAEIVSAWGIPYRIVCDKKAAPMIAGLEGNASILEEDDFLDLIMKDCKEAYYEAAKAFGRGYEGKNPSVIRYVAEKTKPPPEIEKIAKEILTNFSQN